MTSTTKKTTLYADPGIVSFDDFAFEKTAKILYDINPAASAKFIDIQALIDWMKTETMFNMSGAGFWGTLGFLISVCKSADGKGWYATASIAPYMVETYIKSLNK